MIGRLPGRATLQRTAVRLAMAGTLGIISMLAAESWRGGSAADAAVPMADVLVTARSLEAGSRIAAADLATRRWPAASIDRSWLAPGAAPQLVGQVATARLAAGTPISRAMLLAGGGSSLAAGIRPGRRAISIAVSPAGGLSGFLAPGDRVDVLLTQTLGKRRTAQTLLADLAVLGVDSQGRGDPPPAPGDDLVAEALATAGPPGLVTLEVSPREAEALAVAAELGTLSLVLRGPAAEPRPVRGRRWDSDVTGLPAALLAASDAAPAAAPLAAPQPAVPAAAATPGGVEISYGLPPAAAPAEGPK
jgi:pilus assembly protein CpaB